MSKIKNLPIQSLIAYQQIIEESSHKMSDFFNTAEKNQKDGVVSKSYIDQLERTLGQKINANNLVQDQIEKEIRIRTISTFGRSVTMSNYVNVLIDEFTKEAESHKNMISKRKEVGDKIAEKHKGKINTKISKEKIVK